MNPDKASIIFLGGAGTVTGSKILFQYKNKNILIDCGLFQGIKELRVMNWEPLPIEIYQIDAIIITHAHLDHVGYLPRLVKEGYDRTIYTTAPTKRLAEIILYDSAQLQEEEAELANREGYSRHSPAKPLYTTRDVQNCLQLFEEVEANQWIELEDIFKFRYQPNGHILGSCLVELLFDEQKIVFSGDLGRTENLLLSPPSILREADYLVLESTYGDRNHTSTRPEEVLTEVIEEVIEKKGNLIIPSFAIERAQELICMINILKEQGRIPDIPVFLDSPMAIDASEIFYSYSEWHKLDRSKILQFFGGVTMNRELKHTFRTMDTPGSKIIIAGSGMLTGGRVLEYLKAFLDQPQHTILLVGYQAIGTRGRDLLENAPSIRIHGRSYAVKAQVKELQGMSGHADQQELLHWLSHFEVSPKKIFLNHGEPESSSALKTAIEQQYTSKCLAAVMQQRYWLD
jgi:metallo-beta-lactamase family protein